MNKVILAGRLTADPEIRYTTGENPVTTARFSVAVQRSFKDSSGEYKADFIRCVAWRKTAEFIEKYFHKGDPITIDGNIRTGDYVNKDGIKVYTTEVWIDNVEFALGKNNGSSGENTGQRKASVDDSFMNIPDGIEDDLPFDV